MQEKNEKIEKLTDSATLTVSSLADVDTVIGKPITTASGFQIIPFSKVTLGSLSGGGEYGETTSISGQPFAGGNGAVVSMKPMGFLLDDGKTCRMLRVSEEPLDNLIEHASDLIQSLTAKHGEE